MDGIFFKISKIRIEWILLIIVAFGLLVGVWLGSNIGGSDINFVDPVVLKSNEDNVNKARFIIFGDSGNGSKEQLRMAKLMDSENFDAVLHTGDVAYKSGSAKELKSNHDEIYSLKIKSVLYPTPGNHDYKTEDLRPYLDYFALPASQLNNLDTERYYSTDIDGVHVVSLDSNRLLDEISDTRTDDMADWLIQDLSQIDSNQAIVVITHFSPFNIGEHGPDLRVLEKLVPIFDQYGVDIVLSGHDHNYQRTCPLKYSESQETCRNDGVVYVVTGGGGASLYKVSSTLPGYMEVAKSTYNYVRMSVDKYGVIILEAIDQNGEVFDQTAWSINHY